MNSKIFFAQNHSNSSVSSQRQLVNEFNQSMSQKQCKSISSNNAIQQSFSQLGSIHTVRRVSFQSFSGIKIQNYGYGPLQHLQRSYTPQPIFNGSFSQKEKQFVGQIKNNNSMNQGANLRFPTIELGMQNLRIESEEFQNQQQNEEKFEKKANISKVFYQGLIEMIINDYSTFDFSGKIIVMADKIGNRILKISSPDINKQKIKLNKKNYKILKKYGKLKSDEIQIWDRNCSEWLLNQSIQINLQQYRQKLRT